MKTLSLLACAALSFSGFTASFAAENDRGAERGNENAQRGGDRGQRGGDRGGQRGGRGNDMMRNMMRGFGRGMMGGDSDQFLRQSKSDNIQDHESAALTIMKKDAEERIAEIKEDIFEDNQTVREAYEAAVLAQMAFLEALESNPEIKKLNEEREGFMQSMRSGDWGKMRENMNRMGEVSQQLQALVAGDENIQAAKKERVAKASAFTKALAEALESNESYQAALEDSKRVEKIQGMLREEQMAKWQNRARNGQDRNQGRKEEADKPAQDVKDF